MRITHVSLNGPVTDNLTYQDNLLPKYHKINGHEVSMITSKYIFDKEGKLEIDNRSEYTNENGIKTIRLNIKHGKSLDYKFKRFIGLYESISSQNPDILFVHGLQFVDVSEIVKYMRLNPNVKLFIDNHADYFNSAKSWISRNILHKYIWRKYAKQLEPYATRFYGVLPARSDFLENVYDISKNKIELLFMGADDNVIEFVKNDRKKYPEDSIRNRFNLNNKDFVIISGGKIDNNKAQIITLMEAIKHLNNDCVKLFIFGSVSSELKNKFNSALSENIIYLGWVDSLEIYKYLYDSDLVVFPGLHSVLWEQTVGLGKPCVFKYIEGFTHIDLGGNCKYLYNDTREEIITTIENIIYDKDTYEEMKRIANERGVSEFSYRKIAQRSIMMEEYR